MAETIEATAEVEDDGVTVSLDAVGDNPPPPAPGTIFTPCTDI